MTRPILYPYPGPMLADDWPVGLFMPPDMDAGDTGAFNPLSLTSLKVWLDPNVIANLFQDSARTTSVTANGDPVGADSDQSGNGNHVINATVAQRGVYAATGINSKPGVTFTPLSGAKHLTRIYSASLSQPVTVVFIMKCDSVGTTEFFFDNNSSSGTGRLRMNMAAGGTQFGGASVVTWSGNTPGTNPHIWALIFNGANSALYQDGGAAKASGNIGTNGMDSLCIGGAGIASNGMDGKIGPFMVFNEALSSANLNNVGNYLATEYGLTWNAVP